MFGRLIQTNKSSSGGGGSGGEAATVTLLGSSDGNVGNAGAFWTPWTAGTVTTLAYPVSVTQGSGAETFTFRVNNKSLTTAFIARISATAVNLNGAGDFVRVRFTSTSIPANTTVDITTTDVTYKTVGSSLVASGGIHSAGAGDYVFYIDVRIDAQ